MERSQLEHLIRAASAIAEDDEFVIVGSQSILGAFPDAPDSLKQSREADIYPRNKPEKSDLIDGSIGEASKFDEEYGYYAQGVDARTAVLPLGWEGRLTKVQSANTRFATGYCIDVHDLALSKYVANREKDRSFNRELMRHQMVDLAKLRSRVDLLPIEASHKESIRSTIERDIRQVQEESADAEPTAATRHRMKP